MIQGLRLGCRVWVYLVVSLTVRRDAREDLVEDLGLRVEGLGSGV